MITRYLLIIILQGIVHMTTYAVASGTSIINLKTEYMSQPLGLDVEHPRFSWQMESDKRGAKQVAYRIWVFDERGKEVWNSEKINSGISLGIRYAGYPLKPRTRYSWQIEVWDQAKKKYQATSWFETGLLSSIYRVENWNHAKWIGGGDDDMPLYAMYLPVFKIDFSLQLDETNKSTTAGFIYGANDPRLLASNLNHLGIQNPKDSSYIKLMLDIAPLRTGQDARIHVFRRGYAKNEEKEKLIQSFGIPQKWLNNDNKYHAHRIHLSSVLGHSEIYINGEHQDNKVGTLNLNPLGQGGDFIAFPVLGNIGFFVPLGNTGIYSDLSIRNFRSPQNVLFAETTAAHGMLFPADKEIQVENARYICHASKGQLFVLADPSRNAAPMLRTTFTVATKTIEKARLYITARGVYEAYMNGERIGEDYFNPGLTQYNKTHMYQTFDVTNLVHTGDNAWGAVMSEGWWSGGSTYMGEFWNFFGDRQSLLGQLIITYTDGTEDTIVTQPGTWKYYNEGPVRYGSFFQGEVYDARREQAVEGWSTATYKDSKWTGTAEIPLSGNISLDRSNINANMPMVDDYSNLEIIGDIGPSVRQVKELTAIAMEEIRPGVYLYDMGQNMAGVPVIDLTASNPGDTINLRYAEVRYPDLPAYTANKGMPMLENIRAAMAQDIYIARGGQETITPRFTYHGYQYLEISGIQAPLPLSAVRGRVLSSVHQFSSHYETSDTLVNKLWQNITWSTLANFIAIPTDCPQRNERLGWSGDISVFARTATYLADMPLFLQKHLRAMRDVQDSSGRFPDVAPLGGGFGGVLWGSAGITVAWENYNHYGDIGVLESNYEAMKKYIDFLTQQIDPKTGILCEGERSNWGSLGDWLSPEYKKTEKSLLWEAYYLYDLEIMNKVALILDKVTDAKFFYTQYQSRKQFFNDTYIDANTGKTIFRLKEVDTQASYALPLQFGLLDSVHEDKVRLNFVSSITRENKADDGRIYPSYSLMTGFIGTSWINHALSKNGDSDVAYKLLLHDNYPSWLYPVTQGATTIWERLNSYTHRDGFGGNNRMNSFNHYSFGAVGAWMYEHSLGIRRSGDKPAFKHFILSPEIDPSGRIRYAKGHVDSPYGRIESSWEKGKGCYTYRFTIPANTSATVIMNTSSKEKVKFDHKGRPKVSGITHLGGDDRQQIFELTSGSYEMILFDE